MYTHRAQEGYWVLLLADSSQSTDILDLRVGHQDKTFLQKDLKWNNGLSWRYSAKKVWHVDFLCYMQCKIQKNYIWNLTWHQKQKINSSWILLCWYKNGVFGHINHYKMLNFDQKIVKSWHFEMIIVTKWTMFKARLKYSLWSNLLILVSFKVININLWILHWTKQ